MVGEPESGTIWWDLSGPGRLQPQREPSPPMSGKQCPADNVAGPAGGWKRLDRSFPPFKKLICTVWFALAGTRVQNAPKGWWVDPLASNLGKVTQPSGYVVLVSPVQACFLRVQPPRQLNRSSAPGWEESGGDGWRFRGHK